MNGTIFHVDTAALSIATFFDTVDRTFFTPNFGTYEHLTYFNDPRDFKMLVLGIYLGLVIASLFMCYNKCVLGGFIRKLNAEGALSEESAKTLSELGFSKNPFVKLSLKRGYSLRRVVSYVPFIPPADADEDGAGDVGKDKKLERLRGRSGGNLAASDALKEKLFLDGDRFYLPEEKRDLAIQRFRAKGSGLLNVALFAVIGLAAVVAVFKLAPFIVSIIESLAESISGGPDVLN